MSADLPVPVLDVVLHWPIRLMPTGDLAARRADSALGPAEWLESYTRWIAANSPWQWVRNPYAEAFGTPAIYEGGEWLYQEFLYFHPFIRDLLYEPQHARRQMTLLARDDLAALELRRSTGAVYTMPVRRTLLYLFATDVAILTLQLQYPPDCGLPPSLAEVQDLLNEVRRVYPAYWNSGTPGSCPHTAQFLDRKGLPVGRPADFAAPQPYLASVRTRRQPPAARHWLDLLAPIAPWAPLPPGACAASRPDGIQFRQIIDERIPLTAFLLTDTARMRHADFVRLTSLDESGQGSPYSETFLEDMPRRHWYDRWWHLGTRFLVSESALVTLARPGAFSGGILRKHAEHHYQKLFLLALLQKASLLVYWDRLASVRREHAAQSASMASQRQFHRDHQWLTADLASYLAIYEFSEATSQVQGVEIFSLLRRHMGSVALLRELREQTEFAAELERNRQNERMAENQLRLQSIANRLVWVSAPMALAGVIFSAGQWALSQRPPGSPAEWPWIGAVACFSISIVAAVTSIVPALRRWNEERERPRRRFWIVPRNDLEALAIIDLLQRRGEAYAVTGQGWGASWTGLEAGPLDEWRWFRERFPHAELYGIELAGTNTLGAIDIDHHLVRGEDRRQPLTSLEQVAAILNHRLSVEERLIAINDRGHVRGLLREGVGWDDISRLRQRDRAAQGLTWIEEAEARREAAGARLMNEVYVVTCATKPTSAHGDELVARDRKVAPYLLLAPGTWEYSGPAAPRLAQCGYSEEHWSGGEEDYGFFGIAAPGRDAAERICAVLGLSPTEVLAMCSWRLPA